MRFQKIKAILNKAFRSDALTNFKFGKTGCLSSFLHLSHTSRWHCRRRSPTAVLIIQWPWQKSTKTDLTILSQIFNSEKNKNLKGIRITSFNDFRVKNWISMRTSLSLRVTPTVLRVLHHIIVDSSWRRSPLGICGATGCPLRCRPSARRPPRSATACGTSWNLQHDRQTRQEQT